jgi:hypothetical protein
MVGKKLKKIKSHLKIDGFNISESLAASTILP